MLIRAVHAVIGLLIFALLLFLALPQLPALAAVQNLIWLIAFLIALAYVLLGKL